MLRRRCWFRPSAPVRFLCCAVAAGSAPLNTRSVPLTAPWLLVPHPSVLELRPQRSIRRLCCAELASLSTRAVFLSARSVSLSAQFSAPHDSQKPDFPRPNPYSPPRTTRHSSLKSQHFTIHEIFPHQTLTILSSNFFLSTNSYLNNTHILDL